MIDIIIISTTLILAGIAMASSAVSWYTSTAARTALGVAALFALCACGLLMAMLFTLDNLSLRFILGIAAALCCLVAGISNLVAVMNMQTVSRTAYTSAMTALLTSVGALVGTGALYLVKQDVGILPHVKPDADLKPPYTDIYGAPNQLNGMNRGQLP